MDNTLSTELLFEMSQPGRRAQRWPACDVPDVTGSIPAAQKADKTVSLPELAEFDVVRHYTNLSTQNMCIDTNFYPLGSCTMKYNPKRNERLAALGGIADLHPYQTEGTLQGMLQLLYGLEKILAEIAGLDAVSLQPAAGAHGEMTALLAASAYFRKKGEDRRVVLIPDSAHGTNPASANLAGFECVTVKSTPKGYVNLDDLKAKIDSRLAVFMITNPNTVGMFDHQIGSISELVHAAGGLMYLDGANMNAILGQTRPGDFGIDLMHYNPHKTFSGPHGGGGPGAGPIAVRKMIEPFLPRPRIIETPSGLHLEDNCPDSIGRVRSFFGNTGVLVRAYCYILSHGPDGLKAIAANAVLNANYLMSLVKDIYQVPMGNRCMHEFVACGTALKQEKGVRTMDIAKRLLDYGFHSPTVYFPLIIDEALMVEPTETENKQTLELFAKALHEIVAESADQLHDAPHAFTNSRPDEVRAARQPILRYTPAAG